MLLLVYISTIPLSAIKLCQFASVGGLWFFRLHAHFENRSFARD